MLVLRAGLLPDFIALLLSHSGLFHGTKEDEAVRG